MVSKNRRSALAGALGMLILILDGRTALLGAQQGLEVYGLQSQTQLKLQRMQESLLKQKGRNYSKERGLWDYVIRERNSGNTK